ncbi:MAG TPA: type II toxin-antitoxin system VapC family toxin [Actinomycetales bacterium]|nr:type II toxin-antitoxin system VapC family toxin [Actinomycetales bacterium]
MLLPDVNVLVYATRRDSPRHAAYRDWLDDQVRGPSTFAMSELVLSGFIRVMTHPGAFKTPTATADAVTFVKEIIERPHCRLLRPGPRHLRIFLDLCTSLELRGNGVPDAYQAALAIESGSEWVTTDRGFARFPGLRWRHPLD